MLMGWIEKYGHGGDLQTAASAFGVDTEHLLDFSANINPLGPPLSVIEQLQKQLGTIIHYPDPAQRRFRQALADRLEISPEQILAGNGAAECMALAILGLAPRKIGVVYPCFSEYTQLAHQFGVAVTGCYGRAEQNFQPDMGELRQVFQEADVVFIGHPNNPTGILYEKDSLLEMAKWTEAYGTYLILDEAFLDFVPVDKQVTLLPEIKQFPHVLLIRSMTKFYAIPGLRLGYTVAAPSLIESMKGKQVTWSVNQLALLAGELCLRELDYERETRELIVRERTYLMNAIQERFGWQVEPGQANFLLIRLPQSMQAQDLQLQVGRKGVMIRNCSMYPGLTPQDFRIAVKSRQENDRLLQAFAETVGIGESLV